MWQVVKPFLYICSTVESWYGKRPTVLKKKVAQHIGSSKKQKKATCSSPSSQSPQPPIWHLETLQGLDLHRFGFLCSQGHRKKTCLLLGPGYAYIVWLFAVYINIFWVIIVCFYMDLLVIIVVYCIYKHLLVQRMAGLYQKKGKINSKPPWPAHGPRLPWWRPTPHNCTTCPKDLPGEKKKRWIWRFPLCQWQTQQLKRGMSFKHSDSPENWRPMFWSLSGSAVCMSRFQVRLSHRPVHTKGRDVLLRVSPSCLTAGSCQKQTPDNSLPTEMGIYKCCI